MFYVIAISGNSEIATDIINFAGSK